MGSFFGEGVCPCQQNRELCAKDLCDWPLWLGDFMPPDLVQGFALIPSEVRLNFLKVAESFKHGPSIDLPVTLLMNNQVCCWPSCFIFSEEIFC